MLACCRRKKHFRFHFFLHSYTSVFFRTFERSNVQAPALFLVPALFEFLTDLTDLSPCTGSCPLPSSPYGGGGGVLGGDFNFNSPTLHPHRFLYLNPPKSAQIRGYPPEKRISVSADFKSVKKMDIRYLRISNPWKNGYPLSADIKSVEKRISVNPRISNPWKKRISVIRG